MKIISYNVNGIRAAIKKGFADWLVQENPDVVCIQETKAQEEQIDAALFKSLGYHSYWFSAQKKGYSGVGILTKIEPDHVEKGMGIEKYDAEGRMIRVDIGEISIASIYHPSGTSGDVRQDFKMQWLDDFQDYVQELRKERPNLILGGDYNIAHKEIDIHDPKGNKDNSGFLPEERAWVDGFIEHDYIDTFRYFHDTPDKYSWWTYRFQARSRNKGWRIDYFFVTKEMEPRLKDAGILDGVYHSDHCPISLIIA